MIRQSPLGQSKPSPGCAWGWLLAAKGFLGFSKKGHRAFRKHAGSVCRSVREQLGSAGLCWTRAAWEGSLAAAMTGLQSLVNEEDSNMLNGYKRVLAAIECAHVEGLKQPAEALQTPKQHACSRRNPRGSKEAASGADQQTIRCSVKVPQGQLLQLQMPRSADVKALKGAISARTAIPTLEQKLVAGGKPLRNATQLGEACAGEELNVVVNFGLAGGAGGADAADSRSSAMEVSDPPLITIRRCDTEEICTLDNPPRLCKDVLQHLDETEGWGRGKLTKTLGKRVISVPVNDQVHAGSYTFKEVPAAARGGTTKGAGASGDVEMPYVDHGRAAGTRQTGAVAGPSQDTVMQDASRGDYRRRSNDEDWDDSVDEEVRKVLERAFVSPEKNGQPELDLRPLPSSNPCARRDVSVVYYGNTPSLLLTSLPERNERGLTNAQTLLAQNKQLHASKGGQDQVQTRATALIAPSGGGKSRTALEASCHEYSFYLSFSTEKEPGTNILREAIDRLRERHRDEFARVRGDASGLQDFRENMLHDMKKFISRILLAFALGLLEYLRQHGDHASPRGFLLFQLIGISTQEDWLLKTWGCLLSLSREAVELKLQATMEELRRRTRQDFFNTFLDESQAGMRILDGYFPSRDGTEGRPLLNGLVRSLHHNIFTHFHFNLTGTGLSLRLSQQLDTAVSEEGAAQLASFTDFPPFTMDGALQYTQEFLQSPPEGARVHILVGRPRFAAQLVQKVLLGKSWEEALQALVELHSGQNSPTSLLRGLHEMQTKLSGDLFDQLVAELRCLVLGYYVVGKGVSTGKTNVDMIEVGVCHLAHLGGVGEYSMMTLVEPLAALAVTSFLRSATHWRLEDQGLALLRTSPSDAAMGALFERIIPQAQLRLVTSNTCLADHPLFEGFVGLPNCFYGPARVVSLLGQGEKSYELKIDDIPRVETWRKGHGLIEFLREPGDVSFFFPEEGAGPDHASYLSIADELWLGILQAKCRKKVPNKAHALGTLNIRTMYKGEKNPGEKRSQLTTLLKQRGVKGILRILLAYPAQVNAASYAQSTLRRSERLQALEGNEFEVVQLCISRSNAEHYLTDDERHHLDCLKDIS